MAERTATAKARRPALGAEGALFVLLLLLVVAIPLARPSAQVVYLASLIGVYAIAALSLALLYGQGGILSVSHGALLGVGGYAATILITSYEVPPPLAFAVAAAVTLVVSVVIGYPSLRLRTHYFVISTFIAVQVLRVATLNLPFLGGALGISLPIDRAPEPWAAWLSPATNVYWLVAVSLVLVVACLEVLKRAPIGRDLLAIRENEALAMSLGVNTSFVKLAAFAISGVIAGVAGCYLVLLNRYVTVEILYSNMFGLSFIVMLLIGGSRHWVGPVGGALVYVMLPYLFRFGPLQNEIASGVLLIVLVLTMPSGLIATVARLDRLGSAAARIGRRRGGVP